MPRSIEKVSALVVVQASIAEPPEVILVGDAESVHVGTGGGGGGGGGGSTEIPAVQVVCPPGPETVIV